MATQLLNVHEPIYAALQRFVRSTIFLLRHTLIQHSRGKSREEKIPAQPARLRPFTSMSRLIEVLAGVKGDVINDHRGPFRPFISRRAWRLGDVLAAARPRCHRAVGHACSLPHSTSRTSSSESLSATVSPTRLPSSAFAMVRRAKSYLARRPLRLRQRSEMTEFCRHLFERSRVCRKRLGQDRQPVRTIER
jgi:hypothetical protein